MYKRFDLKAEENKLLWRPISKLEGNVKSDTTDIRLEVVDLIYLVKIRS
jgi:hypothetical protein